MEIASVVILIIGIVILTYAEIKSHNLKQIDKETEAKNQKILETYNTLIEEEKDLLNKIELLEQKKQNETNKIKELNDITKDLNKNAAAAFEQYVDALEESYKQKEEEFENNIKLLDDSYMMAQNNWLEKQEAVLKDLNKIKQTRAAAMEAQRQEKLIKENKKNFSLNIDDMLKNDVHLLERIKKDFSNPRIISMLIWQTYFRDMTDDLCNYILGTKTVCGIYKITNQITDECYIGQSVDVAKRWKSHIKCGLDIDRPKGNKLYQAMQEDEIWNFTFELLEECKQSELNEKEKFYIELYQSKEFGYNSTRRE